MPALGIFSNDGRADRAGAIRVHQPGDRSPRIRPGQEGNGYMLSVL